MGSLNGTEQVAWYSTDGAANEVANNLELPEADASNMADRTLAVRLSSAKRMLASLAPDVKAALIQETVLAGMVEANKQPSVNVNDPRTRVAIENAASHMLQIGAEPVEGER